jgi:hypothetical protein
MCENLFVFEVILLKYKNPKTKKMFLMFFAGIVSLTVIIDVITPVEEKKRQKQEIENAGYLGVQDTYMRRILKM